MSADNYYAVYPVTDATGTKYAVCHGFMSCEMEDCMYRGQIYALYKTREKALVAAHDLAAKDYIVEYGVIELDEIPKDFCRRCYVCVHERKLIDPELRCCDVCSGTISDSESFTMANGKTMHNGCDSKDLAEFMSRAVEGRKEK